VTVVLRAEGLVVRFGGVAALDSVEVSAAAGCVVGLVGANGAGKTTLLDCLSGQLRPQAGRIWLDGRDVTRLGPGRRARLGVVRSFHDARLFPTMAVPDVLRLAQPRTPGPGRWPRRSTAVARAAAREELAERMDLAPLADRRVGELSTGERKRLDLACALAGPSRVLLLDEPSAGLAAAEVAQLARWLRLAVSVSGAAVVMVEHDLPLVWTLADRVVVLAGGHVVAEGPPAGLARHPALAFGRLA
jgi:ABC-type branched-subunit amino acid transport system ATPase component